MADEENPGVNQASPEPEASNVSPPAEQQPRGSSTPSAGDQEHNWKEMRSAMKELAEKNRMLEEALTKMAEPTQKQADPDELDSLGDEDIVTKKQLMSFGKKMSSKAKEEAFKEFYNKTAEERLESKYNDFRSVCSAENIDKLKQRYPDLARSIAANTDAFSQGKAAYDLIVSLGIHDQDAQANREKIQQNMQKPQTAGMSKAGPLDSAHLFESGQRPALTKSLKDQLRKEMDAAIKSH